ncbi:MAG: hypothetical protein LBN05_03155 [Oscillospiraceae bacterium]|jgi:hypothetical protein|nr:hypothetical protein [Oscillospiraceae bacterium]
MKKLWKALKIAGISLLALLVAATGYYFIRGQLFPPTKVLKNSIIVDSLFDIREPVNSAATLGYIFVAKVEKITDYHANKLLRKFPAFIKNESDFNFPHGRYPYSELNVTVVRNIKGNLPEGKEIPIYAGFGYNALLTHVDRQAYSELPETGKTYLFLCNTTSDNDLVVISDSQTHLDGEVSAENVAQFDVVRSYQKAVVAAQDAKNVPKIVLKFNAQREIFLSKYDSDYTHKGQKIPDDEIVGKE